MPYKKRTTRKPYKKRAPAKRNYKRKSAYRNSVPRSIENATLRPMSRVVKFQARERYLVNNILAANIKSVLRIPLSYFDTPTAISGVWSGDSGNFHPPNAYNEWFPKFKYYKVLGARVSATIRPSGVGEVDQNQFQNLAFMGIVPDSSTYSAATPLENLEEDRGVKQAHWRYSSLSGGMKGCHLAMNYSAKKTHNLSDVKDYSSLRVPTTFGTQAAENTFCNIILSGALDQATTGHPGAIVDVYATYIVSFSEPSMTNIPE